MSNDKGSRTERELVNLLDEAGFAVIRAPSSGSATDRDLPDVLAGNGFEFYAIEAKSSGGDRIYLTGEEVESLIYFSQNFGAKARIAVRFDEMDWYFFHPGELYVTDDGNYRVKRETAIEEGKHFSDFVGETPDLQSGESPDQVEARSIYDVVEAVKQERLSIDEAAEILDNH